MEPRFFRYEADGPITTITFDRPERRNGLDPSVMLELEQLILRVRDDRQVRALIVTGSGNSFCAGADLSLVRKAADAEERRRIQAEMNRVPRIIGRVFDVLANLDVMTVAAINGYAVGGGWSLALAHDHCLAVPEAEFWVPEVDIGVPFRGLPSLTLTARLGPVLAKEAMILCRRFTAAELASLGVINRVVPAAELLAAAREVAEAFAAKPTKAAVGTKRDINAVVYGTRHF
jgi:2-(1,2-epoxy-1,2-dihydrophenyl)acetyl-CoA isomerase